MLNGFMICVTNKPFMLSVVMLNVVILSVGMLNIVMLNVVMLNVVMLNVVMLSVVMLNVVALPKHNRGKRKKSLLFCSNIRKWLRSHSSKIVSKLERFCSNKIISGTRGRRTE